MKKIIFTAIATISLAFAGESNLIDKINKCYNILSNDTVEFSAKKSGDGYDVYIKAKNQFYKRVLKKDAKFHIKVDKGPLITSPKFTFGKAGLVSKGSFLDILNSDLVKEIKKAISSNLNYTYKGIVDFSNKLKGKEIIEGIKYDNNKSKGESSNLIIESLLNIDNCTASNEISLDYFKAYSKKEKKDIIDIKNVKFSNTISEAPIDNIPLFGKTDLEIEKVKILAPINNGLKDIEFSTKIGSKIEKIDSKYLNFNSHIELSALNTQTIALSKGIKEAKLDFALQNIQTQGLIGLIKLSKELEQINEQMQEASIKNDDVALQKAILKMQDISSKKTVDIYNKIFIKDKTRLIFNLELDSDKKSFIKLNLLYKAAPISGSIDSALITLAAQNLAVADGDIEISLDSSLATSINPLAVMFLEMYKQKGIISLKNGVYHLKATLKGGKIIINGKSYTLEEFSTLIFK